MEQYKGIYYGENNIHKFYEGKAHFKYEDLYNALKNLGGKINDINDDYSNSNILILNSNENIKKDYSNNLITFNYLNSPNIKAYNNSSFLNINNDNKQFLFKKIKLKKSNEKQNKRDFNNIKTRNLLIEKSSKSLNINKNILLLKNSSSNKIRNIKNLNIFSHNINFQSPHNNIPIYNNESFSPKNNQLNSNNLIINKINTNYLKINFSNNNKFKSFNYYKNSRNNNNFSPSNLINFTSVDIKNKIDLKNIKSIEKINFRKLNYTPEKEEILNSSNLIKIKKKNDLIFPNLIKNNLKFNKINLKLVKK